MPRRPTRLKRRGVSRRTRSPSETSGETLSERSIAALAGALLLIAILAAYSNHFHNGFHYDDGHTIVNNAAIRDLRNIPAFFRDGTTFSALPSNQSYRPLVSTLLAIDYQLGGGLQPFWFHASILGIFIALTLLLAFVIYHFIKSDAASSPTPWIAIAAAACYGLHPANADAINYIVVSAEVISTLGVIASFAVYFAFPRFRRYYLFVLPAAIAVLGKPPAAIFPLLFVLFRLLFPEESRTSHARARLMEMVAPFVVCGAVLLFVQHMTPQSWSSGAGNAHDYLITQPYVALLYFKAFFWPTGLSADYGLDPFVAADARFWMGVAFVVALAAAAITAAQFNKTRLIGFGLLWFLITLLPTSLFPLAEVMNDYRTFLPYIGLVIALAGAGRLLVASLDRQSSASKIAVAVAVILFLCGNGYATFQRNKVWQTEETLWHDVVLKNPRNGRGLMVYGIQLMNKGDFVSALDYFDRAQQFSPRYSVLLINRAIAENATGQSAAAEQHFKEALRMAPALPDPYTYYARYLTEHSRAAEARTFLRQALAISPTDVTARELLNNADLVSATQDRGVAHLGRNNNQDGDPQSFVRQKFRCGNDPDKWCTIQLLISFYKTDNESLKITLSGEAGFNKTVYLKTETTADPNIPKPERFGVSVKGCTAGEVKVEITEGDTKNIQSHASVALPNPPGPMCTDTDMTGGEGASHLVSEHAADLP
jgi:protein O-mannosyl-transferase